VLPRFVSHFFEKSFRGSLPSSSPVLEDELFLVCSRYYGNILLYIFVGGLECVSHSFAYVAHFVFKRCLDSNPESCRSKQARYQLSHPSPSYG
jgi:hypothetical protein